MHQYDTDITYLLVLMLEYQHDTIWHTVSLVYGVVLMSRCQEMTLIRIYIMINDGNQTKPTANCAL